MKWISFCVFWNLTIVLINLPLEWEWSHAVWSVINMIRQFSIFSKAKGLLVVTFVCDTSVHCWKAKFISVRVRVLLHQLLICIWAFDSEHFWHISEHFPQLRVEIQCLYDFFTNSTLLLCSMISFWRRALQLQEWKWVFIGKKKSYDLKSMETT